MTKAVKLDKLAPKKVKKAKTNTNFPIAISNPDTLTFLKQAEQYSTQGNICLIVTQKNKILFANHTFDKLTGYSQKSVTGKELKFLFTAKTDFGRFSSALKKKQIPAFNSTWTKKDKSKINVKLYSTPMSKTKLTSTYLHLILDTTVEEEAMETLVENRRMLLTLMDNLPGIVYRCKNDKNWTMEFLSETCYDITGYKPDDIIKNRKVSFSQLVYPEDRGLDFKKIQTALKNFKAFNVEYRIVTIDGIIKWVKERGTGVYSSKGKLIAIEGFIEDITAQKEAAKALSESEHRYKSLFNNHDIIMLIIDPRTLKILDANPAAVNFYGYNYEQFLTKRITDINNMQVESLQQIFDDLNPAFSNKYQFEHRLANGSIRNIESYISIIKINDKNCIYEVIHDATSKKLSEETLKASEERYRHLSEMAEEGILIHDNFNIVDVNDAVSKIFGYSRRELLGMDFKMLLTVRSQREIVEHFEDKNNIAYEINGIKKDGTKIVCRTMSKPFSYKNKTLRVVIVDDITDQKQLEQYLIDAKDNAEKSEKLKSEFLAQISHEIRTPINTVLSFSSLIEDEVKEALSEDLKQGFFVIKRAGSRIIRTIDLILNMSEIQAGTFDYRYKNIDLYTDVLENLYMDLSFRANEKGIELKINKAAENCIVYADEYTINQIFTNLIDNAIKFTLKGEVLISLSKQGDENLVIEIKDTGIGISQEYLPDLFSPFSQEDSGYTRRFEGNGLGLALVKKYCDINNASLEVESAKGVGSVFRVSFKLTK